MQIHGMNITVVTTADSDKAGVVLLEKLGMPFTKGSN
jgi:large subunit ribosomal protein L5